MDENTVEPPELQRYDTFDTENDMPTSNHHYKRKFNADLRVREKEYTGFEKRKTRSISLSQSSKMHDRKGQYALLLHVHVQRRENAVK